MDILEFQRKWIGASGQKERSTYVTHFNDLCDLLDVPNPLDADPAGTSYCFERGAKVVGGNDGWADVWYRGHFAFEYKGKGKDLEAAYGQLLRYKDALENPPLLVVCDLNTIQVRTNFTNTVQQTWEVDLAALSEPGVLAKLKTLWTNPAAWTPTDTPDSVTIAAAARFSEIALGLYDRGEDPEATAHFLVQVVFCLFAEDIGLLPDRIFSEMVTANRTDPRQFQVDATELFQAMNTGGRVAYKTIPWVNGGLFKTVDVPLLDVPQITLIRESTELDWSQIEPAILGTLFERSLDPTKRSQLGAHYTSKADIQRVVQPVVMDPLRRRFAELRETHGGDVTADVPPLTGRKRTTALADADAFLQELREVTILDPACGSGNFLYVALSELLTLEKEVMTWRANVAGTPLGFPEIRPTQVKGIEINAYAQQLAQAAIWIGYLQWMTQNHFSWSVPVLAPLDSIEHKDALLTFHEDGTVTETDWPEARFIIGNPPFVGGKLLRRELGEEYVEALFRSYSFKVPREADLVAYFFAKTGFALMDGKTYRAGLLATQTIRVGSNRRVLQSIAERSTLCQAWSDQPWVLSGASVRISIVVFGTVQENEPILDGGRVSVINSDLTGSVDLTRAKRLPENASLAFQGDTKGGPFDIESAVANALLSRPLNPNGRPNSDVVRPWFNGRDITDRPKGKWIIDFGVNTTEAEAALYEGPFEYALENIKPARIGSRSTTGHWWLHERPRADMRAKLSPLHRFIATPRVAKHRFFVFLDSATIPDNRLAAFARQDDFFFGVLSSFAHTVWSLRTGARHGVGNDPVYMPTTCFETFPLPWAPGTEPVDDPRVQAIAAAAKELDRLRTNWLNPEGASEAELKKRTLTNLYNERPTWLRNAHATLDRAVWDAYGWPADKVPSDVPEEEILGRLLELNRERAGN